LNSSYKEFANHMKDVEADEIAQRERTHGVTGTEFFIGVVRGDVNS
jgi:hypothetical protein